MFQNKTYNLAAFLAASVICLLSGWSALAALGDHVDRIESADMARVRASSLRVRQASKYTVHELETPISKIKEYVSQDGTVFAVSWSGIKRPDLSVLLGSHYNEYSQQEASLPKIVGRQIIQIRTPSIVVQRGGHMRDIHGFAYLVDALPAGVSAEELQ